MEAIMEALQKRYSFESLYIVPRSEDKTGFVISGIYGSTISTQERDMFMKLKFDVETDKRSIFVKGLMQNRTIYVPRVMPDTKNRLLSKQKRTPPTAK